jgi:L-amino acid N-acyltransferase YncA
VIGYAYAVPFRKRPAYRYVVKHSIYVHSDHLHSGIGRLLLPKLIDACAASGYRQMIGYIDASNRPRFNCTKPSGSGRWVICRRSDSNSATGRIRQRSLGPGATSQPDMWL